MEEEQAHTTVALLGGRGELLDNGRTLPRHTNDGKRLQRKDRGDFGAPAPPSGLNVPSKLDRQLKARLGDYHHHLLYYRFRYDGIGWVCVY